ncbi:1-acyl-sn-glycerol-3-phosphate acyltransferase [Candidatus Woesearchaeota archaeon]|nr:1-acyl-sn-glycerol-3-phosphate acyltransferase [Candidatus Woesearchaeota archaeon]
MSNKNRRRNTLCLALSKTFAWPLIKTTSFKEYEVPKETKELIKRQNQKKDCALFFAGPHRSMWETVGIPYTITKYDGDTPFALMGNNLIKKETGIKEAILKYVIERSGIIWVEREKNPKAAIQKIIQTTETILSKNRNIMLFPEGTRSRDGLVKDFKPSILQGAINASKNTDVYIIPINVDYSKLLEINEFAKNSGTYTFTVKDLNQWKTTHLGEIYISFDKPILISPDTNRKIIAYETRKKCLDLVKIQPINIVSTAITRLNQQQEPLKKTNIEQTIEIIMKELEPHQEKYRGFKEYTEPNKIIKLTKQEIKPELITQHQIYANYIAHYF